MATKETIHVTKGHFVGFLFLAFIIAIAVLLFASVVIVPAGHVKVATLFGSVQKTFDEGLHFANPLYGYTTFDARSKTIKETVSIPSQDQMTTRVDVSVQYRLNRDLAEVALKETGKVEDLVNIHLIPMLRSLSRESGKTIERAEDFFNDTTQRNMQEFIASNLVEYVEPKGLTIEAVLLRDITLPPVIASAVARKKEREQAAEQQKAELTRYRTEQEQKVALAEAERDAAALEAEKKRLLADARAYEIEAINQAIADNPAYLKLEALKALAEISKDPSAKIYFLNGDSPQPLPLMHIGDTVPAP
jgi:regulator of protease activity HflC (stomatin/prohibitin superfamily)